MTLEAITAGSAINFLRFVDCCTGAEIFFRGSLPVTNGQVFLYTGLSPFVGSGGNLEPNKCYTVFQDFTTDPITYPPAPTLGLLTLKTLLGCEDPECADCNPTPLCECPEGFTEIDGECVSTITTTASYSGGLLTLNAGQNVSSYSNLGIRLYDDVSTLPLPILGSSTNGANSGFAVRDNTTTPVPIIATVQSTLWGCSSPASCSTFAGPVSSYGGKLNTTGLWATGYLDDTELCFEFCVTIEKSQQYLIGIAGDNSVAIYIDNVLTVSLQGDNAITRPFNYWHVFPVTLSAGTHTIKLCGINDTGSAAFGAEIYDISLATFQANFLNPAVGPGNCGNTVASLEPFIIFSTADLVGQQVADPSEPGVWSCPDGGEVDFCNGTPSCTITEKIQLACDCFLIIPCDGSDPFVSNNQDLANYVDGFHTVIGKVYNGCAYITKLEDTDCNESVEISVDPDIQCDCDLQCYFVYNTNGFLYVDANNVLQEVSSLEAKPYVKICSKILPIAENSSVNYQIENLGLCEENTCPVQCYKLTNCETKEVIYSNSDSLLPYLYGTNTVVRILGKEGCWIVSELDREEVCDCPIDITVSVSFATCEDCVPVVAYKLTSCEGNSTIYTLLNLESYIGQVIRTDCGCYKVEQINYLPPNPQTIKLEDIYKNCTECTRSYWKLEDCQRNADPIITYTDLSAYEGKVIKIENCDECWTVTSTLEHLNASIVTVTESHEDCDTCLSDQPCLCTTLINLSDCPRTYGYLDCDKEYHQFTLQPNEKTDKICATKWFVVPFCECFQVKVTIEINPGQSYSEVYIANAIEGEYLNCYPVYNLCLGPRCGTVSFDGTNWVIYDQNGVALYKLIQTSFECVFGRWVTMEGNPIPNTTIESYACPDKICTCVNITVTDPEGNVTVIQYTYYGEGKTGPIFNNPTYGNLVYNSQAGAWLTQINIGFIAFFEDKTCPVGEGIMAEPIDGYTIVSEVCSSQSAEFLVTDYFETFGECKQGVCPPPVFKNNRTVRPGYNTPICTPEKYDMITCNFADILYKIALEKRYGITNCCPDDDDKWLIEKELIDLQALKDPNYNCSECTCGCNKGNTCDTCNCKN